MVKHCFRWWLYPDQELNSAKIEKLPSFQVFQEFQVFLVFAKIMKFGRIQQELWNSAGIVQFSQNCETHRPPCQPTFTPPCRPPFQPPCPSPCQPPRQPPFASTLHQLCNILVWSGRIWIHYRQYAKTVSGQGRLGQLKNLLQVTGVMIIWNLNLVISHFELSLIWPASRRATLRIKYKTKASGSPLSQVEITFKSLSWRCWSPALSWQRRFWQRPGWREGGSPLSKVARLRCSVCATNHCASFKSHYLDFTWKRERTKWQI